MTLHVLAAGNDEDESPVNACRPNGRGVALTCDNMECVPWSYVCDNENDCGCTGNGCDEDKDLCNDLGMCESNE